MQSIGDGGGAGEPWAGNVPEGVEVEVVDDGADCVEDDLGKSVLKFCLLGRQGVGY